MALTCRGIKSKPKNFEAPRRDALDQFAKSARALACDRRRPTPINPTAVAAAMSKSVSETWDQKIAATIRGDDLKTTNRDNLMAALTGMAGWLSDEESFHVVLGPLHEMGLRNRLMDLCVVHGEEWETPLILYSRILCRVPPILLTRLTHDEKLQGFLLKIYCERIGSPIAADALEVLSKLITLQVNPPRGIVQALIRTIPAAVGATLDLHLQLVYHCCAELVILRHGALAERDTLAKHVITILRADTPDVHKVRALRLATCIYDPFSYDTPYHRFDVIDAVIRLAVSIVPNALESGDRIELARCIVCFLELASHRLEEKRYQHYLDSMIVVPIIYKIIIDHGKDSEILGAAFSTLSNLLCGSPDQIRFLFQWKDSTKDEKKVERPTFKEILILSMAHGHPYRDFAFVAICKSCPRAYPEDLKDIMVGSRWFECLMDPDNPTMAVDAKHGPLRPTDMLAALRAFIYQSHRYAIAHHGIDWKTTLSADSRRAMRDRLIGVALVTSNTKLSCEVRDTVALLESSLHDPESDDEKEEEEDPTITDELLSVFKPSTLLLSSPSPALPSLTPLPIRTL